MNIATELAALKHRLGVRYDQMVESYFAAYVLRFGDETLFMSLQDGEREFFAQMYEGMELRSHSYWTSTVTKILMDYMKEKYPDRYDELHRKWQSR